MSYEMRFRQGGDSTWGQPSCWQVEKRLSGGELILIASYERRADAERCIEALNAALELA